MALSPSCSWTDARQSRSKELIHLRVSLPLRASALGPFIRTRRQSGESATLEPFGSITSNEPRSDSSARRSHAWHRPPCPLWVKSRHQSERRECPLYPRKRTCAVQCEE